MGETVLTFCKTLLGGSPEPFCGFDVINRGGEAEKEKRAEVLLCDGVSMLGSETIPVKGKSDVAGDTIAVAV